MPGNETLPVPMPQAVLIEGNHSPVPHHSTTSRAKRSIRKASKTLARFFGKHKESPLRPPPNSDQQTSCSGSRTAHVPANVVCAHGTNVRHDNAPGSARSSRTRDPSTFENGREDSSGAATATVEASQDNTPGPRRSLQTRDSSTPDPASVETSEDNSFEATATFFESSPGTSSSATDLSLAQEVDETSYTLESIRDRDVQLRILRHCNQGQQHELETSRKLVKTYIEKNRGLKEETVEWQNQVDKALALVGHWRLEASKQKSCIETLQQQLRETQTSAESRKADEADLLERYGCLYDEKARMCEALSTAQDRCSILQNENQALVKAMQELDAQNTTLESEKNEAADSLATTKRDYEVLLNHKTSEYIADPALKEPLLIEPNEIQDLQQTLEQSKKEHARERELHSHAWELAQCYKKEAARAEEDKALLHEKIDQLQTMYDSKCIVEKHHSAVSTLFAAGKLAKSESALTEAIEKLIPQLVEDKISAEMLGQLMQEISHLKAAAQDRERNCEEQLAALREQKKGYADEILRRESGDLEQALELSRLRDDHDSAQEQIDDLTTERDYWKNRCVNAALGETEKVLFETKENQLRFYKNLVQDQSKQLDAASWDLVMMHDWASTEVKDVGMHLEQIAWYKAQVDALEAHFAEQLQFFPLQMPFRPVWKTLSKVERQDCLKKEAGAEDAKYDDYKTIREEYLNAEPSDHELLAAKVGEEAPARHQRQASLMVEAAGEMHIPVMQSLPHVNWAPTIPQLPSALLKHEVIEASHWSEGETSEEDSPRNSRETQPVAPANWAPTVPQLPPLLSSGEDKQEHDAAEAGYGNERQEPEEGNSRDSWETLGEIAEGGRF